ncbi:MAG: HEAT repeat domain-containing protein [Anaerolineae bacterium]|nr:HEAT repeat domain-containing protein [Anaerolineae bacterium]
MTENFDLETNETVEQMPTLDDALAEMTSDGDNLPSPDVLYGLSGLSSSEMARLKPVWDALDPTYCRILMQMLVDASESNFELNYAAIAYANLNAKQAEVRQAAIELLWEDESESLLNRLIEIVQQDAHVLVRAEAAKSLGRFILLGELGNLSEDKTNHAQDVLLNILQQDSVAVEIRCQALESVANCTRKELIALINEAYKSHDDDLRASAIVAMGRTCDARWEDNILDELEEGDNQLESVRAAGELQLDEAVAHIVRLIPDANRELLEAIIWALGEIGGKEANRTLEILSEKAESDSDDTLLDLIDDAIGNASLAIGDFAMHNFSGIADID